MNDPLVLGALLRVELRGWTGAAPRLPDEPLSVEENDAGSTIFIYDLMARRALVPVPQASERIGMTLERLLETWPFADLPFPARCVLDVGVSVDDPNLSWSASWPAALLAVLADGDIELRLSVYPATSSS